MLKEFYEPQKKECQNTLTKDKEWREDIRAISVSQREDFDDKGVKFQQFYSLISQGLDQGSKIKISHILLALDSSIT